ncbi:MAG: ABC transporter permease [Clostridia bacterium]|nr:ABC transporter permease [Clostridia bacterium]
MFSKSLFKQSCKANGIMWIIITAAVCFMLCCVMLISGNGNLGETKAVVEDAIIKGELDSQIQGRAMNYYELANGALERFDEKFKEKYVAVYAQALQSGKSEAEAKQLASVSAYSAAAEDMQVYYASVIAAKGYAEDSQEAQEIKGVMFYILNPLQADGTYMFDSFYKELGEEAPRYDALLPTVFEEGHKEEREKYVMANGSVFLAGNMVKEENIQAVLDILSDYGITMEKYEEFGFSDYGNVKQKSLEVLVNYRANLAYRLENIKDGETTESIKAEIIGNLSGGLLSALPKDMSDALQEIGQADLYGALIGSVFFKMAGLLLPIIYMIMASNALIAGQVDSGSMAYILSSGTKRKEVTFTQAAYLISSILVMFILTTVTSMICFAAVDVATELTYGKLALINLGAFFVMFAMSGICFLASCCFNRSKHSMALGGGLNMFFLVATMLGLFGSPVLPSIIRMEALNAFNYVSIISLFDVVSILEGTTAFIWKWAILIVVGIVCYIAGSLRFKKKDLPL